MTPTDRNGSAIRVGALVRDINAHPATKPVTVTEAGDKGIFTTITGSRHTRRHDRRNLVVVG